MRRLILTTCLAAALPVQALMLDSSALDPGAPSGEILATLNAQQENDELASIVALLQKGNQTGAQQKLAEFLKANPTHPGALEIAGTLFLARKQ